MIQNNSYRKKKINEERIRENYRLGKLVALAKPAVQNFRSQIYPHIRKNFKKQQIKEERYTEIERENRMLLEKLQKIVKNKSLLMKRNSFYPESFGSRDSSVNRRSRCSEDLRNSSSFHRFSKPLLQKSHANAEKIVFNDMKLIQKSLFSVKISQHQDQIKILVKNSKDTFQLKITFLQALMVMKGKIHWEQIADSLCMEADQMVLYQQGAQMNYEYFDMY